jgi:hypothetical protein
MGHICPSFEKPSQRDMNYSRRAERHAGAIRAH